MSENISHPTDVQIQWMIDCLQDGVELDKGAQQTLEHVRECGICEKKVKGIVKTISIVRQLFATRPEVFE